MNIKRGEIWYYDYHTNHTSKGILSGPRPVLIISNNKFNECSPVVNVLGISGKDKESPVHFKIKLEKDSFVNCEQIQTINKKYLKRKISELDDFQIEEIKKLLMFQLHL